MANRRTEFTEFASARRPQLRRLAYALCGDWHQADDLVQITLSKLYVAWPRIHRQGAEDAYARKVLLNAHIDAGRRPWRRESVELDGFDHPSDREPDPGARTDLVRALQQVPPMQRRAVVLRHWWGLSTAETAHELGISEGAVKSHTSRALERLHTLMADPNGASR